MKKPYSESSFAIDLIMDSEKTINPTTIKQKCKDLLDVYVSITEIMDYMNIQEDYEKESWTIESKDIFYEKENT